MEILSNFVTEASQRAGVDLATLTTRVPAGVSAEDHRVDPVALGLERAEAQFDTKLPTLFRHVQLHDPRVVAWLDLHLANPLKHGHLLLQGDTGTGKTHHAVALLKRLVIEAVRRRERPSWHYVPFSQLAWQMNDVRNPENRARLDRLVECDYLVLDDLGTAMGRRREDGSSWTLEWANHLIDQRYSHGRTTVYGTNVSLSELDEVVDSRIASRLMEGRNLILFSPNDQRRSRMDIIR